VVYDPQASLPGWVLGWYMTPQASLPGWVIGVYDPQASLPRVGILKYLTLRLASQGGYNGYIPSR